MSGIDLDALQGIDEAVDAAFEPLRGQPLIDRTATVISNLSDYGAIWVVLALYKARRRGPDRRRAVVALAAAGFSSLLVSRAVKQTVSRQRPDDHLNAAVRTPTSSSFPSGHTTAAFATAFLLGDTDAQTTANVAFATAVAASRVHLRAHHPSDVAGGAVVGTVLGLGLRPIVDLVTPGTRRGRLHGSRGVTSRRRGRRRRAKRGGMNAGPVVLEAL